MDTGEVAAVMSYASEKTIPVVVRGAGTGLVGGAVAVHGGIMLDTTAMNHILELDRENLTVTVEPGVLLMDLAAYVEENNLFYPPLAGISVPMPEGCARSSMGLPGIMSGVLRWCLLPAR